MKRGILTLGLALVLGGGIVLGFLLSTHLTREVEAAGALKVFRFYPKISAPVNVAASATADEQVSCDAGDQVTGGGYGYDNAQAVSVNIETNRPDNTRWHVIIRNLDVTLPLTGFQVHVICADVTR